MFKNKLLKYIIFDVLRSKVVIVYSLFLMLFTLGILYLGNDISKATISLLNVVLLLVPLISIVFGTMYFYNLKEFKELLLSQPVSRTSIILGEYFGLSVSLALSFLIGVGTPLMIAGFTVDNLFLLLVGTFLTFIFVGLAFLSSVITSDKVKGMGIALFIWFYFSIIFDGLVLSILVFFEDYPLEKVMLLLTFLNPIDLARVIVLLKLDISVLMGYTGALYQKFFGTWIGITTSIVFLILWSLIPTLTSVKIFSKKDF